MDMPFMVDCLHSQQRQISEAHRMQEMAASAKHRHSRCSGALTLAAAQALVWIKVLYLLNGSCGNNTNCGQAE